jgi:hypothetical protein
VNCFFTGLPVTKPVASAKSQVYTAPAGTPVAVGVNKGKRRPLEGGKEQIFRWDQFSQEVDIPALKIIALAETGDAEVLLKEDQILRIAEEYANEIVISGSVPLTIKQKDYLKEVKMFY